MFVTFLKVLESRLTRRAHQKEEMTLGEVRRIESDRGEFSLLINSLQHQIVLLSKRIDDLEVDRDNLERENVECAEQVGILKKRIEECEKNHNKV